MSDEQIKMMNDKINSISILSIEQQSTLYDLYIDFATTMYNIEMSIMHSSFGSSEMRTYAKSILNKIWIVIKDYDSDIITQLINIGYFTPVFEWGFGGWVFNDTSMSYNNDKFKLAFNNSLLVQNN